jgi:hypothetical protein
MLAQFGQKLNERFEKSATTAWPWLEPRLAYANARIPQALILAGVVARQPEWAERGLSTLNWLVAHQASSAGHFCPVGSEGAGPSEFGTVQYDQQPIEAWATVSACLTAAGYRETYRYRTLADWAFGWFMGQNVRGLALANAITGACSDGLQCDGLNLNQGAESTLAYLISLAEIRQANEPVPSLELSRPVYS